MANRRNGNKGASSGRDAGGFIALPWSVIDSPAYAALSHPARSLLLQIARQFVLNNNGHLRASSAYLAPRGWKSADVITRAKRELLAAGFIFETFKGHRPNKASRYAITWQRLDKLTGYDEGAERAFERSAYLRNVPLAKNPILRPAGGVARPANAPRPGAGGVLHAPSCGANVRIFEQPSTPPHGNHLDTPSLRVKATR